MFLGRTLRFLKLSGGNLPWAAAGLASAAITTTTIGPIRRIVPPGVTCDGVMISPGTGGVASTCEQLVRTLDRRVTFNLFRSYAVLPLDSSRSESLVLTFLLAVVGGTPQGAAVVAPPPPTRQATATRAVHPVVIDGRDDDDVWKTAQPITDFVEFDPDEGKPARFP